MQNALKNKTKYITLKERFKGRSVSKWKQRTKKKDSHYACSVWHCHCLHLYHRSFCEKAYDRHQEELRLQAVETKDSEIDEAYQKFEKKKTGIKAGSTETRNGECRTVQKTEDAYEECSAHYEKSLRR